MAEEIKTMEEGTTKQKKIKEGIFHGMSSFISENRDKVDGVSVYDVFLSKDCRLAKIFINTSKPGQVSEVAKYKPKIYNKIKEAISSKYLPSIEFIDLGRNE